MPRRCNRGTHRPVPKGTGPGVLATLAAVRVKRVTNSGMRSGGMRDAIADTLSAMHGRP